MGPALRHHDGPAATTRPVIRIVLDTNVLVSVALPSSRVAALADAWQRGRCRILLSRDIFDEYLRVFTYPKFRLSSVDIASVLEQALLPYCERVTVTSRVEAVADDPSDNKFLACAADGRADFLVSGDHHLLALKRFRGIPIVSPRSFLEHLAG